MVYFFMDPVSNFLVRPPPSDKFPLITVENWRDSWSSRELVRTPFWMVYSSGFGRIAVMMKEKGLRPPA